MSTYAHTSGQSIRGWPSYYEYSQILYGWQHIITHAFSVRVSADYQVTGYDPWISPATWSTMDTPIEEVLHIYGWSIDIPSNLAIRGYSDGGDMRYNIPSNLAIRGYSDRGDMRYIIPSN